MGANTKAVFTLRPMGLEDLDRIADWFDDFDDVALFDRNLPIPASPEYLKETWKSALEYSDPPRSIWFMAETDEGKPAGVCGLQSINYIHGDAIVPIFVSFQMRQQGLAQAMSVLVIDMAFEKLRLHRLTTFFREDNLATPAITKKLGFVEEGCMRQAWYSDGRHKDVIQVGLLKETWLEQRESICAELEKSGKIAIHSRRSFK